jgi:hypothetical protein
MRQFLLVITQNLRDGAVLYTSPKQQGKAVQK